MITKINRDKLYDLIVSFYNLTGIKVAVYDNEFQEILAYPKCDSPFCQMIHNNSHSSDECAKSMKKLCAKCAAKQEIIIEKCHAGLTEVIAPLTDGLCVIGYIMFGQITNQENKEELLKTLGERCLKYNLSTSQLYEAAKHIRYYSDKQLSDASKILNALSIYIVFEKLAYPGELSVVHEIMKYIKGNLEKDLTVSELCKRFYLSKSELYKITKPYMPNGVAAFIKKERMSMAADLLCHTSKPAWEIAQETGFSDVNYFLRRFKKEKGISAAKYKKENNCKSL